MSDRDARAKNYGYFQERIFGEFSDLDPALGDALITVAQLSPGAVARTQHDKNAESITAKDFGAVGDGKADDSVAIRRAFEGGLRRLVMQGHFKFDPTQISLPIGAILEVEGSLRPQDSLVLPSGSALVGKGGTTGVQFQRGPAMELIPPPNGKPALVVRGSANHYIANVAISDVSGIGILLDGASGLGALARLENVCIATDGRSTTAIPLVNDAFFWVFVKNCAFLASKAAKRSMRITNTSTKFSASGLIYVEDTIFSSRAVEITSEVQTRSGNVFFRNCHMESAVESFFVLDSTKSGTVSDVVIDHCDMSDSVASEAPMLKCIGNGVAEVKIINTEYPTVEGLVDGLYVENHRPFNYTKPYRVAQPMLNSIEIGRGEIRARNFYRGFESGPTAQFGFAAYGTYDFAKMRSRGAKPTFQLPAPDGSSTAVLLEPTSGSEGTFFLSEENIQFESGDYIIAGFWERAIDDHSSIARDKHSLLALANGGATFADGRMLAYGSIENKTEMGIAWHVNIIVDQVTAARGTPTKTIFTVAVQQPFLIWQPFLLVVPAKLKLPKSEIFRIANNITKVVGGAPGGSTAVHAHQALYFGGDVGIKRTRPGVLGMDKGTLACATGTSSDRPNAAASGNGAMFVDLSIGKPIWSINGQWRDANGHLA